MFSLSGASLFAATSRAAWKAAIDKHTRPQHPPALYQQMDSRMGGRSLADLGSRLAALGFGDDRFDQALKAFDQAGRMGDFMDLARTEIDRKAATEKLTQAQKRMKELEAEARRAAAAGDTRKLTRIAAEASGMVRAMAQEAKRVIEGEGEGDPALALADAATGAAPAVPAPPGGLRTGLSVSFARAFITEVRDLAGRARSILSQADLLHDRSAGGMDEEERRQQRETLRRSREDLAESDQLLTRLSGLVDQVATATDAGTAGAALDVTASYVRVETVTLMVAVSDQAVSLQV